jgi:hypothetical protein
MEQPNQNPYAPPAANLASAADDEANGQPGKRKRPILVWLISLFYAWGIVGTIISFAMIFGSSNPVFMMLRDYYSKMSFFPMLLSGVGFGLTAWGTVQFFRLKSVALKILLAAFAINILSMLIGFFQPTPPGQTSASYFSALGFGVFINFAVILYVWRLVRKGILR